jgi:hypothetical protein
LLCIYVELKKIYHYSTIFKKIIQFRRGLLESVALKKKTEDRVIKTGCRLDIQEKYMGLIPTCMTLSLCLHVSCIVYGNRH